MRHLCAKSRRPTLKPTSLQLLDDIERGETVVITRGGRPIARIVPEVHRRQQEVDLAIAEIKTLRKHTGKITLAELLSARHEGHQY